MNHINSPSTEDSILEKRLVAEGATAPRVTPPQLAAIITSEHYFTASQGARMAGLDAVVEAGGFHPEGIAPLIPALELLTICVLVLKNGFTVTGESACASPSNFRADIGRDLARENAMRKIWPLLGYELRTKLSLNEPIV